MLGYCWVRYAGNGRRDGVNGVEGTDPFGVGFVGSRDQDPGNLGLEGDVRMIRRTRNAAAFLLTPVWDG